MLLVTGGCWRDPASAAASSSTHSIDTLYTAPTAFMADSTPAPLPSSNGGHWMLAEAGHSAIVEPWVSAYLLLMQRAIDC